MSFYDKKSTLMPMVIAPDVWQSAVAFPADPLQVEKRLPRDIALATFHSGW